MVDNMNLESFNERLGKLEKSNKMLRKTVIILSLVLIVAPIVGWQATTQFFKVIETEKLILKDGNGKERAVLLMDGESNSPKLRFIDTKGNILNSIGVHDSLPYIRFFKDNFNLLEITTRPDNNNPLIVLNSYSPNEKESIDKSIIKPGGSRIIFSDGSSLNIGRKYMYLKNIYDSYQELETTEACKISFIDKSDKIKLNIGKNNDNIPFINTYGDNDSLRTAIINGGMFLFDYLGRNRISIILDKNSDPRISIYDKNSNLRTSIGTTSIQYNDGSTKKTAESAIWLFDQNGNGLFNAPN